jgi:hypothetical protein
MVVRGGGAERIDVLVPHAVQQVLGADQRPVGAQQCSTSTPNSLRVSAMKRSARRTLVAGDVDGQVLAA